LNSFGDFIESFENEKTEKNRHIFLYGLGASNILGDSFELYMNATANYRAINFTDIQIQSNTQLVDSLIKDESGYSFDLGIRKLDFKPFFLEMGLFYVWYNNKIGEIRDDDLRIRTNIGSAQIFGAEFFLEMDVLGILNRLSSRKLSLFINGSINRGIYVNVNDRQQAVLKSKNRLEEIPNYNLKSGITYKPRKLAMSLQAIFVGEQFSDAANSNETVTGVFGKIPSYQVFDFSSKYAITKNVELTFDINNLLDHSYFTHRATAYPGPGIIPATGRSWNLTLITKF
jgi:Fe(3+) dicitrate transport protein